MSQLFRFVKAIDEELYEYLERAEKATFTKPNSTLSGIRLANERLYIYLMEAKQLKPSAKVKKTAYGYEKFIYELKENIISDETLYELSGIRRKANLYNHSNGLSASNIEAIEMIEKFYIALSSIDLIKEQSGELPPFDWRKIMIDDYLPVEELKIDEYEEGCVRKVLCTREEFGMQTSYIMRQFEVPSEDDEVLKTFLTRDLEALLRLAREGLTQIVKLQHISRQPDNNYFFTCYEAIHDEKMLSHIDVNQWSKKEKLIIMNEIAQGLKGMHQATTPIYHRALNPSAIYIGKAAGEKIIVRIGNFEYAKIESNQANVTLLQKAIDRKYDDFQSNEVKRNREIKDWSKVDVYAFCMLFAYLFDISLKHHHTAIEKLCEHLTSEALMDALADGVDTAPKIRPTMAEFCELLKEELEYE